MANAGLCSIKIHHSKTLLNVGAKAMGWKLSELDGSFPGLRIGLRIRSQRHSGI